MENDNILEKESLLVDCTENGWRLFVEEVSKLEGSEGRKTRRNILRSVPVTQRLSSWENQLSIITQKQLKEGERLKSLTEAKVAVMTTNGIAFKVLSDNGVDEPPQGYIKTMLALNASLPWNRTGSNPITINQLKVTDLEEASNFIKSRLEKNKLK
jgi:hypothetical protein